MTELPPECLVCVVQLARLTTPTVDREVFTVNKFPQLLRWRKLNNGEQLVYARMRTCVNTVLKLRVREIEVLIIHVR